MNSILNVPVSRFANYDSPANPQTVNLLDWLLSDEHRSAVEQIRQIEDKEKRDMEKAKLPCITPSGVFSYRNAEGLVQHSGYIQFDIDFKQNRHITNYNELKKQICNIENVAYCGLSASAKGYCGLIPIAYPEKHKEHFEWMEKAFARQTIVLDPTVKSVSSLRGCSYDPEAYFNHQAKVLTRYEVPPPPPKITYNVNPSLDQKKVEACLAEIEARKIDITCNYNDWFAIGCDIAGTFGEAGRGYYHRFSQFYPKYNQTETDKQYDKCLKFRREPSIATILSRCADAGIFYKDQWQEPSFIHTQAKPSIAAQHAPKPTQLKTAPVPTTQQECLKKYEAPVINSSFQPVPVPQAKAYQPLSDKTQFKPEITKLEEFFDTVTLPATPISITPGETIINPELFIQSYLAVAKANYGKRPGLLSLEKLRRLREILSSPKVENL